MSIIDRVRAMLSRKSDGFIERPKAKTANRHTGRTRTARIGRHRRAQVGSWDIANVCPVCGSNPKRMHTTHLAEGQPIGHAVYTCANQHSWTD